MVHHLVSVLTTAQVQNIQALLDNAPLIDGKLSAGVLARNVKHNLEIDRQDSVYDQLNQIVMILSPTQQSFLVNISVFGASLRPGKISVNKW